MLLIVGAAVVLVGAVAGLYYLFSSETYLYHYTSPESAMKIRRSKVLRMSKAAVQDAVFGDGVYLTSLHPSHGRSRIVANNYDDNNPNFSRQFPQHKDKANFYFRFKKSDLPGVRSTCTVRDVWLYPKDIYLNKIDHLIGETDAPIKLDYDKKTGALSRVKVS